MVSADDVLFVVNELNRDSSLVVEPFQAHFDFGTAASPLATGFTPVNETTQYTADLGYGWHTGSVRSVDRGTSESLTRDFNATSDGTFVVDLPRGSLSRRSDASATAARSRTAKSRSSWKAGSGTPSRRPPARSWREPMAWTFTTVS